MAFTPTNSGPGGMGMSAEPNVTPMIDVLLVLLVIFMLTVPMMRKAIDLQLPDPNPQVVPANQNNQQIVLQVMGNNQFKINSEQISGDKLPARLKEIYDPRPDKIIFVKAANDPKIKYQDVIHAMDVSRGAGVKVIGVAPKDSGAAGGGAPAK